MAANQLRDPGFLDGKAKSKPFHDALSGDSSCFPPLKVSSHRGLPALIVSDEELLSLATPFEFALFKRSPLFDVNVESPIVPVWISFPSLHPHLFSPRILHGFGSMFGRPLRIDNSSTNGTRPSVTQNLVELNVTKRYAS
ncbi:hypothetical protein KFK09_001010 [Dendrobium nobile]|uniref:DUF4283 domain-containing protein n=1 Tax=Dendrobium nobile TaxID=94219 RepID=A0A8T3CD70_DENNO|nr:hypothetical protein KFK09_001010 [Dendrobium nobile]